MVGNIVEKLHRAVPQKRAGERSKNEGVLDSAIHSKKNTKARNSTCMLALAIMSNTGHR